MKDPDRRTVSRLEELPNIGKSIAADLELIGIDHPSKLVGCDPFELYDALCARKGKRIDPCVIDVFMSVVHFMEGGGPAHMVVLHRRAQEACRAGETTIGGKSIWRRWISGRN